MAVALPQLPIAEALAAPAAVITPFVLRPDQEKLIDQIRAELKKFKRVLVSAPTGFGKGIVIAFMVQTAAHKGRRALVLGHKIEIVLQLSANLTALGIQHGIIAPGYPVTDFPIQIGMIATVARRLDTMPSFDLVLVDESHHVAAKTWHAVVSAFGDAFIIGVSATPTRLDGRGLDDIFQSLVVSMGTAELIDAGILSRYVLFAPANEIDLRGVPTRMGDYASGPLSQVMSRTVIIQSAVTEYERLCAGASSICFCVDIAHSLAVVQAFLAAGYRAAHVDADTPAAERARLVAALAAGELDVLSNVNLFSEGVDLPSVIAAILLRPTHSLAVFLQQVGRVLRIAPGKTEALILDLASNFTRFGLPDAPRTWTLQGTPKADRRPPDSVARLRHCSACGAINKPGTPTCRCGNQLQPTPLERRDEVMRLVRLDEQRMRQLAGWSYYRCIDWAGADEGKLALVQRARNYKPGWVRRRLDEIADHGARQKQGGGR